MYGKKDVLNNFANFKGVSMLESLLNKVVGVKALQHRRFPVEFAKFLRIPILKYISKQLLPS